MSSSRWYAGRSGTMANISTRSRKTIPYTIVARGRMTGQATGPAASAAGVPRRRRYDHADAGPELLLAGGRRPAPPPAQDGHHPARRQVDDVQEGPGRGRAAGPAVRRPRKDLRRGDRQGRGEAAARGLAPRAPARQPRDPPRRGVRDLPGPAVQPRGVGGRHRDGDPLLGDPTVAVSRERLDHLVRRHQATQRVPSIAAALLRDGELVWESATGVATAGGAEATPRHRYRVGSITKTFTAAAVMQLVAAGAVGLDDPLSAHLPEHPEAAVTVRRMLAHVSGMQREAPGDAWQTLEMPAVDELLRGLADVEQVLPAGERWHYSNLAYSLLGELVSRRRGSPYRELVQARLLDPAGMTESGFDAAEPLARGYFVRPYTDELVPQPDPPLRGFEPAGGLLGTAADLCRWAAVFLDPERGVLDKPAVDRMHLVHAMVDHERWTLGWGLGLELHRRGERMLAGHSGAMPGYLAQLVWSRADRIACAVLQNSGASGDPTALAFELLDAELDARPAGT